MPDDRMRQEEEALGVAIKECLGVNANRLEACGWVAREPLLDSWDYEGRNTEVHVPMDGPEGYSQTVFVYLARAADRLVADARSVCEQVVEDIDDLLNHSGPHRPDPPRPS